MSKRRPKKSDSILSPFSVRMTAGRWRTRRRVFRTASVLLTLAIIAGLFVMDRSGLFGSARRSDFEKYNNRNFRVVNVVDGDTLDLDCPDGEYLTTRIRLWGVDTPETVKPNHPVEHFGKAASEFTRRNTRGKTVRVELVQTNTRDKYGRLLAYVYLPDGKMLNRELAAKGYAYADPRFQHPHMAEFRRLADDARKNGIGLWADPYPQDWPYYVKGSPRDQSGV